MARCHAAVNIVQEKVCRHGGTLTRVLTDDKGTRLLDKGTFLDTS